MPERLTPGQVATVLQVVGYAVRGGTSCAREAEAVLASYRRSIRENRHELLKHVREEEIFLASHPVIDASPILRSRRERILRCMRASSEVRELRDRFKSWQMVGGEPPEKEG